MSNIIYGFKLKSKIRQKLIEYLDSRPFEDVDWFMTNMFEINNSDPFYTEDSITALIDYLKKCPRKEVKLILEELLGDNDNLTKYEMEEKKEEVKE